MRRKGITALLLAGCVLFLAGCGADKKETKGISNEYVKISKYKGIEVEKAEVTKVTDEEVDNYIQSVLNEHTKPITDRPLQKGDIAQFDYTGKLKSNGEVFDEGSLSLGNGETYVPGFEDGIYGHKLNETFDMEITFPEGYGGESKPELSNAEVIFTITITSIEERTATELTDAFVKEISDTAKTVDEYKKEVRKTLEENNAQMSESTLSENAWNEIMSNVEVIKYPEDRLKAQEKQFDEQMRMIMEQTYHVTFEEYLKKGGMTEEDYNKQITEMSKQYLQQVLAIELIAEKEGLELSEKEYDKEIQQFAVDNGYPDKETLVDTLGEEQVKEAVLQNNVLDWVVENCKQVEAKEEKEEEK